MRSFAGLFIMLLCQVFLESLSGGNKIIGKGKSRSFPDERFGKITNLFVSRPAGNARPFSDDGLLNSHGTVQVRY